MLNIQIEKLYQDQLWVITLPTFEKRHVDQWEATVRAYFQHMNYRDERYLVYDATPVEHLRMTPYMQQRVAKLAEANPKAVGRVAVVMPLSPMLLYVFEPFGRYRIKAIQPNLDVRFFSQRQAAIEWVAKILPDALAKSE